MKKNEYFFILSLEQRLNKMAVNLNKLGLVIPGDVDDKSL